MKKQIKTLCWMLMAMLLSVSCMKSNDSTSNNYNDTAITSFSLGTLNRYLHTTSSTGADSVYKVTVIGSDYKFSIDQVNHRIFNVDSLPLNTDVKHVICNVSSLNNGLILVQKIDSDSLLYYSSTDSIDFSSPRVFVVYASDGSDYEDYTVQVNVHQEEGNQFCWMLHEENDALAALEKMKAVITDGNLFVFGSKGGKTLGYVTSDGNQWTSVAEMDDENAYSSLLAFQNALYTIANGALKMSKDGKEWTVVNDVLDVVQLVAASYDELYGLTADGTLLMSDDHGMTWKEDQLDTDRLLLPTMETAYVCYPAKMTYYADYLLLAGLSTEVDGIASVWRKIVEYDLQSQLDKWVYMDRSDNNRYALPQLDNLVMMYYDDSILAWGIKDGAYSPIYQSRDNGIIWKESPYYKLPAHFNMDNHASFAAATDGKYIWLIGSGTGEVWQGCLNRIAWDKSE